MNVNANMDKHERNLINLFEGSKSKINWGYLKKFKHNNIPESFLKHFDKQITQCS